MTPPTLAKAREILAAAAVNAGTVGNPTSPVVAAAIDVVFARLDHVEGLLAVHEKHLDAWASKPAHPAGSPVAAPSVRVPVVGDGDGPPIGSAEVGGGRATISIAVDVAVPVGRRPVEVRVGQVSLGYAASDAFVDRPPDAVAIPPHGSWSPGPHGRSSVLNLNDHGQLISGCNSTTALVTIRNEAPSGEMRIVCLNGQTARLAPGDTAVLLQRSDGKFERVVQWMPAPTAPATAHGSAIHPDAMDSDMLPCPFCGRTDLLAVESHPDRALGAPNVTLACVRCRACGCAGPAQRGGLGTRNETIANWNRRAAPATAAPTLWQAIAAGILIAQSPGEPDEQFRARVLTWRREIGAERSAPARPADDTCVRCGGRLLYSARQRGDGLCGPCHRKATGTQTIADRCHEAGVYPVARPPRTGYRDAAGVYHPAPDTAEYPAHRGSCAACLAGEERDAARTGEPPR